MRHRCCNSVRGLLAATLAVFLSLSTAATSPGAQTELAWDPSPDGTVVGYRIYYGERKGGYSNHRDVGNVTHAVLDDLPPGQTMHFVVKAYDRSNTESDPSNEVTAAVRNSRPTVKLELPKPAIVNPGEAVTLTAMASDPDGKIAMVEFYSGGNKIGESITEPYAISWVPEASAVAPRVRAVATDMDGATATSDSVLIQRAPVFEKSSYFGRIAAEDGSAQKSGILALNLSSTGAFTAQFQIGGVRQSAKGKFGPNRMATISLSTGATNIGTVSLEVNVELGLQIQGNVNYSDQTRALIYCERTDRLGRFKNPMAGKWSLMLHDASQRDTPIEAGTGSQLTLLVQPSSRVLLAGKLPGKSRVIYSGTLLPSGLLPVHTTAQKGTIIMDGALAFPSEPQTSESVDGTIRVLIRDGSGNSAATQYGVSIEYEDKGRHGPSVRTK